MFWNYSLFLTISFNLHLISLMFISKAETLRHGARAESMELMQRPWRDTAYLIAWAPGLAAFDFIYHYYVLYVTVICHCE